MWLAIHVPALPDAHNLVKINFKVSRHPHVNRNITTAADAERRRKNFVASLGDRTFGERMLGEPGVPTPPAPPSPDTWYQRLAKYIPADSTVALVAYVYVTSGVFKAANIAPASCSSQFFIVVAAFLVIFEPPERLPVKPMSNA